MHKLSDAIAVISTVTFLGVQGYLLYRAPIGWVIEVAAVMALNWSKGSRKETNNDPSTDI